MDRMNRHYQLLKLTLCCLTGALIATAIGGLIGVSIGYFGGMVGTWFNDPIKDAFKTDIDRVLESINGRMQQVYRQAVNAMFAGLIVAWGIDRLPIAWADGISCGIGILIAIALIMKAGT
jgi:hypothetical protein